MVHDFFDILLLQRKPAEATERVSGHPTGAVLFQRPGEGRVRRLVDVRAKRPVPDRGRAFELPFSGSSHVAMIRLFPVPYPVLSYTLLCSVSGGP
jgi:hypothetical protein